MERVARTAVLSPLRRTWSSLTCRPDVHMQMSSRELDAGAWRSAEKSGIKMKVLLCEGGEHAGKGRPCPFLVITASRAATSLTLTRQAVSFLILSFIQMELSSTCFFTFELLWLQFLHLLKEIVDIFFSSLHSPFLYTPQFIYYLLLIDSSGVFLIWAHSNISVLGMLEYIFL